MQLTSQVTEKKVNLSVGGFESDGGKGGHNFRVVRKVEAELAQVSSPWKGTVLVR